VIHIWNEENRKIGENKYLWHDEIANKLGGFDPEAASRISGARFSVLIGQVARLERALTQYFLDFHVQRNYVEVSVPYIVSRTTLQGTGQLPKFEDDLFKVSHQVSGEDAFLIPTAEVPVTNLFRDMIIDPQQLPIQLVCHTPSFRAEAGSYGKDTRGLLRQHQFHKVELVKIVDPLTSIQEHERMVEDVETLLKSLELPFRRVLLCSGDTGFSARICYDLEVWLPGQQQYREISSISNCYDFQTRRMKCRTRSTPTPTTTPTTEEGGNKKSSKKPGTIYPHSLNGSGVAVGRALIAILENYQEADGSVNVPSVLQPYLGGIKKLIPLTDIENSKYACYHPDHHNHYVSK
jgi:seryl-tRNA synthetase